MYCVITIVLLGHSGYNADSGVYYKSGLPLLAGHIPSRVLGNDTLTPGLPWISQEWLVGTLIAFTGIDTPGFTFVKLLFALAACGALGIYVCDLERRGVSRSLIVLSVVLLASAMPIGLRAYVLSYPIAITVAILLRRRDNYRWFVLPLAFVWVNVHGSFPMALVLCAIAVIESWFFGNSRDRRDLALIFLAVVGIVLFLNPFGWRLDEYALRSLVPTLHRAQYIDEWDPIDLFHEYPHGIDGVLVFLLLAIVAVRNFTVEMVGGWLIFGLTLALALHSVRHTPYFYLLGTPVILEIVAARWRLSKLGETIDGWLKPSIAVSLGVTAVISLALVGSEIIATLANNGEHDRLIIEAQPLIARLPEMTSQRHVRLVCTELRQCAQAMWLRGGIPHMLDSRSDPFPPQEWDDFIVLRSGAPGWKRVLAKWNLTDVLCSDEVPLCAKMQKLRTYRVLTSSPDGRVVIFERVSRSANRDVALHLVAMESRDPDVDAEIAEDDRDETEHRHPRRTYTAP